MDPADGSLGIFLLLLECIYDSSAFNFHLFGNFLLKFRFILDVCEPLIAFFHIIIEHLMWEFLLGLAASSQSMVTRDLELVFIINIIFEEFGSLICNVHTILAEHCWVRHRLFEVLNLFIGNLQLMIKLINSLLPRCTFLSNLIILNVKCFLLYILTQRCNEPFLDLFMSKHTLYLSLKIFIPFC